MEFYAILSLALCICVFTLLPCVRRQVSKSKLPPGPAGLPLVGSLFVLGDKPNESLAELAKTHGPLMTLQLGFVTTVVVSSAKLAREVLLKNDQAFAGRTVIDAVRALSHHQSSMVWSQVGPVWRKLRKISTTQIFTAQRLDALEAFRRQKVQHLVDYVKENSRAGLPVDIGRSAFVTILNLISNTVFSVDLVDPKSESAQEFKDLIWRIMEEAGKPNLTDYFPMLRPLDLHGIRRRMTRNFKQLHLIFDEMIDRRLKSRASNAPRTNDLLDVLLDQCRENGSEFSREEIKCLLLDLFAAGSDTSSTAVEWAMAELLRNPHTMEKVRSELSETIGRERSVEESDIARLPYLQAVVTEALRLHPPVPLLIPHRAETSVEIAGFTVPKHAQVLVNAWAISRDPEIWENPTSFVPGRFLGCEVDFRGQSSEFIPFGAGRRICPGLPLALRMVHLVLASLLHSFSWELTDGTAAEHLDMRDKFGITLQKAAPLRAIPSIVT